MLEEARQFGFLGPGPVEAHLDHAEGFAATIGDRPAGVEPNAAGEPTSAVDLGSGGGVPGLALALALPSTTWLLVDAAQRRTAFLCAAVERLGLTDRVDVVTIRAEELGRQEGPRGAHQLVVARGFGPPAVTAECAAPLLSVGGRLVVSEPPEGAAARWPVEGLAVLGMTAGRAVRTAGASFQIVEQLTPCPPRYPRRVGIPAKRPLF